MGKIAKHSILLLFPIVVWSQSYVGKVANKPVHIQVQRYENKDDESKGTLNGYYFYDSSLISIPLNGVFNNDNIELIKGNHYFEEAVADADEVFNLKKKGNQLIGDVKINKAIHPVILTETEQDPLQDFRKPKLTFIRDSIATYGDKELVWFHEKWSKIKWFRLGNGFTKEQREMFNPIIDKIHFEDAEGKLDCNSWEMSFEINLVNDTFISFTKYLNVYCGGVHPSYVNEGFNFDLITLKVVEDIESLYPDVNFFELLKEKYQDEDDEYQQDCEVFTVPSHWDYKTWNLTPKGVFLTPNYPHAMTPCEDTYFLKYEELLKK